MWSALPAGLALLALLFSDQAAWSKPITSHQAEMTAKAWLARDARPLGAQIGRETSGRTESYAGSDGRPAYYVVYLEPSGFVILSVDDLADPIICFADDGQYDPSDTNPLGALVSRDLANRVQRAREVETAIQQGKALPPEAVSSRQKWADLLETENDRTRLGLTDISDVRVAPLVQSRWSQESECGSYCYNYFTPNYYPTGCVATAQAQIVRFYQHPTAGVGASCFNISVCSSSQSRCLRGGDGSGGPYAWASMVLDPDCSTTDAQRQAIGSLCHDVSVSLGTDYCSDGSGAVALETATSLKSTFGYSNAVKGYKNLANIGSGLNGMVNPNLDAGYPVLLGLDGSYGGHAVVADGYGYQSATLYHHLNMGWAGADDAWYNLPTVDAYYPFDTVDTCVYNVYVAGSGEIISGRVVDSFGLPISGATVTALRTGGGTYTATTGSTGIYALVKLPSAASYTVSVTASGHTFTAQATSTGTSSDYAAVSGNVWGLDFQATGCCAASGGCTEYISGVQVGSISNTGTGCSGYGDYTYLSTTMEIGSSYPITVTNGYPGSGDQCGIWIDWNRDNDFGDAGETIVVSGTPGNGPYTAVITPPAGAGLGNTRMRVRLTYTGTLAPCDPTADGEVEDYMIVVSPPTYSISGRVASGAGGVADVTMTPSPSGEPATTDSSGNYTISGLLAGTYTITPSKAGCTFTPASISGITVGPSQTGRNFIASCVPYCTASGGSTTEADEYISGVEVGSISNTGTGFSGYADYTSFSTTMNIGSSHSITVTNANGYADDQCGIWVDWNSDGDFSDSGETISVDNSYPWEFTATITPPSGATRGYTRMRVRIAWQGTMYPCGTTQYGEVEDYSINVNCAVPGVPTGVSASDEAYCDRVRVSWNAVSDTSSYRVYRSTSNTPCVEPPLATGVTTTSYDDTAAGSSTTEYYYSVKAVNACGEGACSATDAGRRGGSVADFNLDCDVDQDDHDLFELCASGPGVEIDGGCESRDLDGDADVDQSDFSIFQRCVSGEGTPADPECAE
ncbi:MAG: GEVED domain-containing protein [Phycisphaerae bacterium]|nr:GEVED domain-containing protein [Phycisphaerae bacterium]